MARISATFPKHGKQLSPRKILETQVAEQVKGFLQNLQWRGIRFQRTVVPGSFSTHEPGTPDSAYIKYVPGKPGLSFILWLELKSPGDRRSCRCKQNAGTRKRCTVCDQKNWQARERERGATVWIVDDFDWFQELYWKTFGFLHSGETGIGQLSFMAELNK